MGQGKGSSVGSGASSYVWPPAGSTLGVHGKDMRCQVCNEPTLWKRRVWGVPCTFPGCRYTCVHHDCMSAHYAEKHTVWELPEYFRFAARWARST